MRFAELLRLTALGIALLSWVDPPLLVAPQPPVSVDVAILRSPQDERPVSNESFTTVSVRAAAVADAIAERLGSDGDVRVREMAGSRLPCDGQRPCVIVTGGTTPVSVPVDRRGPTFVVRVGDSLTPNVAVTRVEMSTAHVAAEGSARVTLRGGGVDGHVTRVRVKDGEAVVGEATHRWTGDGDVRVDVPWWPLAPGARTLVAEASTEGVTERTPLDNGASASTEVVESRWPVLVHEPRPSWATTFVRRALVSDPRFAIDARTDLAPGVSAVSGRLPRRLDEPTLDQARVLVVGAPDALTAADVTLLEGYVRHRGGSLVLVPDRAFSGPVIRLLAHDWKERLQPSPSRAGALSASEWLTAGDVSAFDEVVSTSTLGPAVVATPAGTGLVMVAGAMDAWRHRGSDEGFDRFWRATIARLAERSGPEVFVSATPSRVEPGDDLQIRVTARRTRVPSVWRVTAHLACGSGAQEVVRLWPSDAPGSFVGRARPMAEGVCVVVGTVAGVGEGRALVRIGGAAAPSDAPADGALDALAVRTGGLVATDGDATAVIDALRALRSGERRPENRQPMRSWWWMLPLAACLAGEWWLRRRAGLR